MKSSLRSDEIAAALGGFNFIQAIDLDFICTADFILASARISFKMPNQVLFPGWAFCIFREISPVNRWILAILLLFYRDGAKKSRPVGYFYSGNKLGGVS